MMTLSYPNQTDDSPHGHDDISSLPLCALICAAGVGARAGGSLPKQYQKLNDLPMLAHTVRAFAAWDAFASVHVVISPEDCYFDDLIYPWLMQQDWQHRVYISRCGGATRAQSVCHGLEQLEAQQAQAWVMVHDAARPCVSQEALVRLRDSVWLAARQFAHVGKDFRLAGGLLAMPVSDTIKFSPDGLSSKKTIDRSQLYAAQTPQMFELSCLYNSLADALTDAQVADRLTDEASVMEWAGQTPLLVAGEAKNLKVTYPADFALAAWYLRG